MSVPITKPTVGASTDTWGTTLNTALDLLNSITQAVVKTADESVTASTALQNDDVLVLPVVASAVYIVEVHLITDGIAATGDIKYAWTGPAGSAMVWASEGLDVAAATNVARISQDVAAIGTAAIHGTIGAGSNVHIDGKGVLTMSTTPGNLQMQWAQNSSNATASKVKAGSWLKLTRVS